MLKVLTVITGGKLETVSKTRTFPMGVSQTEEKTCWNFTLMLVCYPSVPTHVHEELLQYSPPVHTWHGLGDTLTLFCWFIQKLLKAWIKLIIWHQEKSDIFFCLLCALLWCLRTTTWSFVSLVATDSRFLWVVLCMNAILMAQFMIKSSPSLRVSLWWLQDMKPETIWSHTTSSPSLSFSLMATIYEARDYLVTYNVITFTKSFSLMTTRYEAWDYLVTYDLIRLVTGTVFYHVSLAGNENFERLSLVLFSLLEYVKCQNCFF